MRRSERARAARAVVFPRAAILLLATFLLFAGAARLARADIRDPMVALDRAYVPALALTNMPGKEAPARTALARLVAAWPRFTSSLDPGLAGDPRLRAVLADSGRRVEEARRLADGGDIARAHDALEHVRGSLWKWRASRGIAYFPDALTAFHDAMEHLVDLATKGAGGDAVRAAYAATRSRWLDVERAAVTFEAPLHGFDAARRERLGALMSKERALLDDYAVALAAPDPKTLATAGRALKGNFAQAYFLFGDFTGLQ